MKVPNWIKVARHEMGVHEKRGGENPRIIEYHNATDLHASEDEVPWCSSFVNWVMQHCDFKGTRSAAAVSWADWGKSVADDPPIGAIVVFEWPSGGHHVGFAVAFREGSVKVLGGNQSDEVNETWFSDRHVMDYRMPAKTKVEYVET